MYISPCAPEATQLVKLELRDLDLILREEEGFAGVDMWGILVGQSEQHLLLRLVEDMGLKGRR